MTKKSNLNSRYQGHTLLEVLVVCALFLGAAILTLYVYRAGFTQTKATADRVDNQRVFAKTLENIEKDLSLSTLASVTLYLPTDGPTNGGSGICLLSPLDENDNYIQDPDDLPLYQAYLIYYHDKNTNTLNKLRIPLASPSSVPSFLTDSEIADAITAETPKLLVKTLKTFQLTDPATGTALTAHHHPFKITIELDTTDPKLIPISKTEKTFRLNK